MACLLLLLRAVVALSKWDGGVNQLNAKWTQVQSNTTLHSSKGNARENQNSETTAACVYYGLQIYLTEGCSLSFGVRDGRRPYFELTAEMIQPLCELRESHPVISAIYARESS
jgi:hypothetical protein